jgi:hypothetical protein
VTVGEVSRPPTTTTEQDLRTAEDRSQLAYRTAGQRRVNLIWEYSQAGIALLVVAANIVYAFIQTLIPGASTLAQASGQSGLLSNAFFLVIGFYFGRTNHARIGDDPRASRRTDSLDDR